jgi:hypothetical protein
MPTIPRLGGALVALAAACLLIPATALGQDEEEADRCAPRKQGEQCSEGNGRKTPGGGELVSHKGWPAITGILWKVLDSRDHERTGTEDNDELLGHHGDDKVVGLDGKDVLWGDWELKGNGSNQSDVLRGGNGNDFLYPSHGKNLMYGGRGNDRIVAYYGHGVIDCGPGTGDFAQTRWQSSAYRVRNCERVRHFCAHGSKPNGDCYKPGEKPLAVLSRQADQRSLLSRLDAW